MIRRFFQGVLFMLLVLVLAVVGYGVWVYRQTGAIPFALPGNQLAPRVTPTPTSTPKPTPTPVMRPVVVLTRSLPAGALLTPDDLTATQMPDGNVPDDAATAISQVVGRLLREPLAIGQPVRLGGLAPRGQPIGRGSQLAQMLHPGEVAIAYPITRLDSVAYAPRPGDRVDIVVTFLFTDLDVGFQSRLSNHVLILSQDVNTGAYAFVPAGQLGRPAEDNFLGVPIYVVPGKDRRPRMVAQLTVRGARVLYFAVSPPSPTPQPAATPRPDGLVVLALSPQDAVVLNFFMARRAATTFVLRSALETTATPAPAAIPVTLDYIQKHYGVPLPPQQPYQINPSPESTPQP